MQVSSVSGNQYGGLNSPTSPAPERTDGVSVSNNNQDKVTLSAEAMKEFEKLAMYSGKAGEYLPKVNVLNNPDSHKIGYAVWEEGFRGTYKAELNEYGSKFNAYYEDTKIEHGILTADDHYEKVLKAEGNNPAFQQAFADKLRSDPRMLELMNILGIKQPT